MNLLNSVKKVKLISVAVVFSLGAMFSANAATVSVEKNEATSARNIQSTISTFLVAQGNAMVADLSAELEKSISSSIDEFSIDLMIDESLAWLTEDEANDEKEKVQKIAKKAVKAIKKNEL